MKKDIFYEKESKKFYKSEKQFYFEREAYHKDWVSQAHFHTSFELILPTKCSIHILINGKEITTHVGEIAFLNPYDIHYFDLKKENEYIALRMNDIYFGDLYRCLNIDKNSEIIFPTQLNDIEKNKKIYNIIENWYELQDQSSYLVDQAYVNIIFDELIKNYGYKVIDKNSQDFSNNLIEYIKRHYLEDITLEGLSLIFNYSKNDISKKLHQVINKDLRTYLDELRISDALKMIDQDKSLSIKDVAFKCGFKSMTTFYRVLNNYNAQENIDSEKEN